MTTKTLTALAAGAVLALAGCSDADPTAPSLLDQALSLNAAFVVADATLEDLNLAQQPFGFGLAGGMGGGIGAGGPAGQPGGGMGVGNALSGTRSATFYDEFGVEQAAYDSLTTATVHYVLDIAGDVDRGMWTGTVSRTRDMIVTGLLGQETTRTHNGTGSETVNRSRTLDDGLEATFDMDGTFVQEDVVIPVPGSASPYPLSGTITRTMKVTVVNGPQGDVDRDVTVVVTFDGDNTATAVVNGETYEIDLDARPGGTPVRGGGQRGRGGR